MGYGDITPTNSLERLVALFIMFFGCGMFAYSLNSVGVIIKEIEARKEILKFFTKKNTYWFNFSFFNNNVKKNKVNNWWMLIFIWKSDK